MPGNHEAIISESGTHGRRCEECAVRNICLPGVLDDGEISEFSRLVNRTRVFRKGDYLFRANDRFSSLYVVYSGFFKSFIMDRHGDEQVVNFYFTGEFMGLDAISTNTHEYNAIALDTSTACRIAYDELRRIALKYPRLDDRFHQIFSSQLINARFSAVKLNAGQKVASLLLGLSRRFAERGFSQYEFTLPMTHVDAARRLRLSTETVSRVFSRFKDDGVATVNNRHVKILDMEKLARLCPRDIYILDSRHFAEFM